MVVAMLSIGTGLNLKKISFYTLGIYKILRVFSNVYATQAKCGGIMLVGCWQRSIMEGISLLVGNNGFAHIL
jgi:hypothetical protein